MVVAARLRNAFITYLFIAAQNDGFSVFAFPAHFWLRLTDRPTAKVNSAAFQRLVAVWEAVLVVEDVRRNGHVQVAQLETEYRLLLDHKDCYL